MSPFRLSVRVSVTRALQCSALLACAAAAPLAAGPAQGGLVGLVEDSRGAPLAGAVISVFGRGLGGIGLVTMSDSAGRFTLPSLPAGSYTLRALRSGHAPAPARQVTIHADREAAFTVSLTPLGADAPASAGSGDPARAGAPGDEAAREARWLLRHKKRSVLEDRGQGAEVEPAAGPLTADAPRPAVPAAALGAAAAVPLLAGTVEVVTDPSQTGDLSGDGVTGGSGLLRLGGRLAGFGRWSLAGVITESATTSWRMATSLVLEPGGGHQVRASTGYGRHMLRPAAREARLDSRSAGAVEFEDLWDVGSKVTASTSLRFTHVGFLLESNHVDPSAAVEFRPGRNTRLRASVNTRTIAPGGDPLRVSNVSASPTLAFALLGARLAPERTARYEVGVAHRVSGTTVRATAFHETARDQLLNAFPSGRGLSARVLNAGHVTARGAGVAVEHSFGTVVHGSLGYTFGRGRREDAEPTLRTLLAEPSGEFHDLVTRLEANVDATGTRVLAFYRFSAVAEASGSSTRHTRFDVQLNQDLPLLGSLTRAEWELLLAVRNLFYEPDEGATFDELVVQRPPRRVLGGIAVRF